MKYIILMAFFICACQELPKLPSNSSSVSQTFKYDLSVMVDDQICNGICVVPIKKQYEIKIQADGKVDRVTWQTCHQEQIIEKPKSGLFNSAIKFVFAPRDEFEAVSSCALEVTIIQEKKRRAGLVLIEFQDQRPEASLMGTLVCNGSKYSKVGVSTCQSASGLYQEVSFPTPALVNPPLGCEIPAAADEKKYRFPIKPGRCTYYFVSNERAPNGKRKIHRLTTIGYTEVPVRD